MKTKIPDGQVIILFCRHLESKSCRKELLRLWSKISSEERRSHKLMLVFGDGKPQAFDDWRDYLQEPVDFIEDKQHEQFIRFGLYSGIVILAGGGLLVKKYPLNLLKEIPPAPYKFLKNQELKRVSKI